MSIVVDYNTPLSKLKVWHLKNILKQLNCMNNEQFAVQY